MPTIVEVRCNEYTMRDPNPNVPWSAEEIAADAEACQSAGASILHFHARDPVTGAPVWETEAYARVIAAVREASDLVVMPTLGASTVPDPARRVRHVVELAEDPALRPDLAPIDLGSFNLDIYDPTTRTFGPQDLVYHTPLGALRDLVATTRRAGVTPMAALWTVGSARLLGALLDTGEMERPAYAQITLSANWLSSHPATVEGMRALETFVPEGVEWAVLTYGADVGPCAADAAPRGGHVCVGLGDYPYPELGTPTNAEVVAATVEVIQRAGSEPASPAEARRMLGLDGG